MNFSFPFVFIVISVLSSSYTSSGQLKYNNTVSVNTAYAKWASDGSGGDYPYSMLGFGYDRTFRKFQLSVNYAVNRPTIINDAASDEYWYSTSDISRSEIEGFLWRRSHYQYVDLGINYAVLTDKIGRLLVGIGISRTWGVNRYIDSYWINPDPPYDAYITSSEKKESFLGLTGNVKYSLRFFKERLNVGPFIAARYYPKLMLQIDTGLKVGFNF